MADMMRRPEPERNRQSGAPTRPKTARIAGYSPPAFPAALKPEFPPDLADRGLSYLESTATAQVPEAVLNALHRFEAEIRANEHEGMRLRRDRRPDLARRAPARTSWTSSAWASLARPIDVLPLSALHIYRSRLPLRVPGRSTRAQPASH